MQVDLNHDIQNSFVYGPVASRRFEKTLGVNLLPRNDKLCNFNCVYCQLGANETFHHQHNMVFPTILQIQQNMDAIFTALNTDEKNEITAIVMSGNGEPTLYPHFTEAVKLLSDYAKKLNCKLVLLSNGVGFNKSELCTALQYIDECCIKWDAAPERMQQNRPLGKLQLDVIKKQSQLILQCCFLNGDFNNTESPYLEEWIHDILTIQPSRVDIYTVSRAPAMMNVIAVSHEKLLNIKEKLLNKVFTNIRVFTD